MVGILRLFGYLTFVAGAVEAVIYLRKIGELDIFETGLAGSQGSIAIILAIVFYHLVLGMLCLGLSNVLESVEAKKEGSSQFKFCPYCHAKIEKDATFCPDCGQEIKDTTDKNVEE